MSEMPLRSGVRLEFKPQDAWIGAYWHRNGPLLDVWVCILPMLPIHVRLLRPQTMPEPVEMTDEEYDSFREAWERWA